MICVLQYLCNMEQCSLFGRGRSAVMQVAGETCRGVDVCSGSKDMQ
jgi:hypothetical protein